VTNFVSSLINSLKIGRFINLGCSQMKGLIVAGFLLLVMAAYLFIPVIPVFEYLINRNYIANNLCVNKDKPKSCCKGKCYMMKQLQKANKHKENSPRNTNNRFQLKELNEFLVIKTIAYAEKSVSQKYFVYFVFTYCYWAYSAIFVPPEL